MSGCYELTWSELRLFLNGVQIRLERHSVSLRNPQDSSDGFIRRIHFACVIGQGIITDLGKRMNGVLEKLAVVVRWPACRPLSPGD